MPGYNDLIDYNKIKMTSQHQHAEHNKDAGHGSRRGGGSHHAHMVADFRRRFWVSLVLTVPVLLLSPLIQDFLGIEEALAFSGQSYVLWGFSTAT